MNDIVDIARYFIDKKEYFTDKQIQKLVYYAYCWYIVKNNSSKEEIREKLFNESPEAWVHGPVFYSLYNEMTYNRKNFYNNYNFVKLDNEIKNLLDLIYNVYGKYSGNQLEALTHKELPWIVARNGLSANEKSNRKLDDKIIYEYYSN